jgi:acyl-CoA dehydrogenase
MSTVTESTTATDIDRFVALAAELGSQFAEHSARHDSDGTFVDEAFTILRESGYLALAVPTELGGMGATIGQVAMAQAEMARYDSSAALAVAMHLHITLFGAWRFRRSMPGAEGLLRRVVDDRVVLVSTGGSDFTRPNGVATKVDGGFLVSGRKIFASQCPTGDVMSTMFTYDDPEVGRQVLSMGIPMRAEGVSIVESWDTIGMRGTGSHDVQITDVFVSDAQVMSRRPWGVIDPPLMAILSCAIPVISGVYLGVAEGVRDKVFAKVTGTEKALDPLTQRLAGLLDYRLRVARWSLLGAIAEIGDDPQPSMHNVVVAMQSKRAIAQEAIAACDTVLELAGGSSYFRRAGLEHAVRDVRGVLFHPLPPELTLSHAGKVALGVPADEM